MNEIDPKALFRLSVLGPLVSRERLERGELQQILRELASREYAIPGTRRRHLGEKTIQAWYYACGHRASPDWRHGHAPIAAARNWRRRPRKRYSPPSAPTLGARSARSGSCWKAPARSLAIPCRAPPSIACCKATAYPG